MYMPKTKMPQFKVYFQDEVELEFVWLSKQNDIGQRCFLL